MVVAHRGDAARARRASAARASSASRTSRSGRTACSIALGPHAGHARAAVPVVRHAEPALLDVQRFPRPRACERLRAAATASRCAAAASCACCRTCSAASRCSAWPADAAEMARPDWSVAIFTSRETPAVLERTVAAVAAACVGRTATIDVLVDGNDATARRDRRRRRRRCRTPSPLRLWQVAWRDKACTWNRYVHELAPDATTHFFVDGYVRPARDALAALDAALDADPRAWAATGVPTVGPSAARQRRTLLAEGGLHGNLYALRDASFARLRAGRLPPPARPLPQRLADRRRHGVRRPTRRTRTGTRPRIAVVAGATWDNDAAPLVGLERARGCVAASAAAGAGRRSRTPRSASTSRSAGSRRMRWRGRSRRSSRPARPTPSSAPAGRRVRGCAPRPRRLAVPVDWTRCDAPPQLLRTWGAL